MNATPSPAPNKRFFKEATLVQSRNGWVVTLDGKPVQTPAKNLMAVPTRALAQRIAAEWNEQGESVNLESMPVFRLANTAIDQTLKHKARFASEVIRIGRDDLISHRIAHPQELADAEAKAWDPYIRFVETTYGIRLKVGVGRYHIEQEFESFYRLEERLTAGGHFLLTGVHNLATLSGSALIALGVAEGFRSPAEAWQAVVVEESHPSNSSAQTPAARAARAQKEKLFMAAAAFVRALQKKPSDTVLSSTAAPRA